MPRGTQSPEHAAKIGAAQVARAEKLYHESPPLTEGSKRCTECDVVKHYDTEDIRWSDFPLINRTWKNGRKLRYPAGKCKDCARKQRHERAARRTDEEWAEFRAKKAAHARAAKKRPQKQKTREPHVRQVDPRPFLDWLEEWLIATGTSEKSLCLAVAAIIGSTIDTPLRRLYAWRHGGRKPTVFLLDEFAVAMGMPEQIYLLYPLDD